MSILVSALIDELDVNATFKVLTETQKIELINSGLQDVADLYNAAGKANFERNTLTGAQILIVAQVILFVRATGKQVGYSLLSSAVNAAQTGDEILVMPGAHDNFTVAVDNLTIKGMSPGVFDSGTGTFKGGVVISGSCSGGGKYGFRMEGVAIQKVDAAGDVYKCGPQGTSRIDHTYRHCKFLGTAYNNGYHAFLCEAGSGILVEGCSVYKSSHGFAIRASKVMMNDLYIEDCGDQSGIIVKSDTGSGDASGVVVNNFVIRSTVAGYARGIAVTSEHASTLTQSVHFTNGAIFDVGGNAINVVQSGGAGALRGIHFTNVFVSGPAASAFLVQSGAGVKFVNCYSINAAAANYSFRNIAGTMVELIGCTSVTPITPGNDTSGTFDVAMVNGVASFGNVSAMDMTGLLRTKSSFQVRNKADSAWLSFATRNTAGAETVVDLDNLGHVYASGVFKTGATTLMESSVALANGAGAAAGTLLNAPAVGNPTKWIAINDNGTLRYVPAW